MPVDLYIGPKKKGAPWWQGCLLSLLILIVGSYLIVLLLASNGIYVSSTVPLPDQLQPTATPSPTPVPKTFVLILKTPTGFLRVRTLPGSGGEEIAEVKPGEKYRYLDTDEASGWYKIQYKEPVAGLPDGITGWVSNQYSQIATESGQLQ